MIGFLVSSKKSIKPFFLDNLLKKIVAIVSRPFFKVLIFFFVIVHIVFIDSDLKSLNITVDEFFFLVDKRRIVIIDVADSDMFIQFVLIIDR